MSLLLSRPLIIVDTETTGVDSQRDRIVELGFQLYSDEFPGNGSKKEWRSLINPGVLIPADATRTHKITNEMVRSCKECNGSLTGHDELIAAGFTKAGPHQFKKWPTFAQLAPNLAKGFSNCDFGGQNVRFDLRLLAAEFARAGVEWNYLNAYILDSSRLEQIAVPRSLSHLHKKYVGHEHEDAHGALADVRAAATVIRRQLEEHPAVLPADLKRLHELQWPGWIDGEGKFKFVDGVPCFASWGKYANQPMRTADNGYWDFILSKDFSADVKALATNAKLGKYPEGR